MGLKRIWLENIVVIKLMCVKVIGIYSHYYYKVTTQYEGY
jgi:hypothetical protein